MTEREQDKQRYHEQLFQWHCDEALKGLRAVIGSSDVMTEWQDEQGPLAGDPAEEAVTHAMEAAHFANLLAQHQYFPGDWGWSR